MIKIRTAPAPLLALLFLPLFLAGANPATAACGREVERRLLGHSVAGQPIEYMEIGTGEDKTLIIATIHGDEWAGTPMVEKLAEYLPCRGDYLAGHTVGLVPNANPDGYTSKTRTNARGVDLNRNFPASNRENTPRYGMSELSEPEARILFDLINDFKPDRIVVIHQPLDMVDWDGPAQDLAQHMSRHTELHEERLGGRPGSMGSHYGVDLRIPIITYELPPDVENETTDTLWNTYARALVASITYPESVSKIGFAMPYRVDLLFPIAILLVLAFAGFIVFLIIKRRKKIA